MCKCVVVQSVGYVLCSSICMHTVKCFLAYHTLCVAVHVLVYRNVIFAQRKTVLLREQTLVVSINTSFIPYNIVMLPNRLGPCCVCTVHTRGIFWQQHYHGTNYSHKDTQGSIY